MTDGEDLLAGRTPLHFTFAIDYLTPGTREVADIFVGSRKKTDGLGFRPYFIHLMKSDLVVGDIAATRKPGSDAVELGYGIAPSYEGRGLATAAARQLIARSFSMDASVREVFATTPPDHQASLRVLEKAGMRYIETLQRDERGVMVTVARYAISRTEWQAAAG